VQAIRLSVSSSIPVLASIETHVTEEKPVNAGKYPNLGLGLGRRAADSDEEEDYGYQQQQRTRRKSFSRLLLDHNKSKDREDHETPTKGGSRGFMGSVRRISLVGRHKRAQSVGLGLHSLCRVLRVVGGSSVAVVKELRCPRCRILSRPPEFG
jgi:hypothetical protein